MSSPQSGDRRDFLKASAAVAGVAASVNFAGAFAAGNDTIKVGLIGCGGRGTGAVHNLLEAESIINGQSPKVEIVAVGDAFKDRAEGAAKVFKTGKDYAAYKAQVKVTPETTFDGLDAYQKVLAAGVDLVILATPPGFRPLHLEAAIKAKKNIFCEKPVAVDATGARKCFELADESKKQNLAIVAGTQRRHQKGYIETIQKLHDGEIGEILSTRCAWNNAGIWFNKRQKDQKDSTYQLRNWYHYLWLCGVINWIMNDHPVKAIGMGGRANRPAGPASEAGQIWDHFAVEFEYKNGVKLYSYCRHIPGDTDVSETVVGSKGICRVNNYQIGKKEVGKDDRNAYVQEHIDLLNSIRAGRPINELKQVTESTFTAIFGRNASYACKNLKWDDALAANEDTMPKNLALDMDLTTTPAPVPGLWRLPAKAV